MWDLVYAVGRVALVAVFIKSGLEKLIDPSGLAGMLGAKAFPMPKVLAYAAGVTEVVLGALVAIGFQARLAAFGLFAFTIVATLIAHNFWALTGPARAAQTVQFWKNVSIMGGLLMVAATGAGRFALGRR